MCGSIFSSPSMPAPPPPPPAPTVDTASVQAAAQAERQRAIQARGRAASILTTDGLGAPGLAQPGAGMIGRKTLLGE